MNTQSKENLKLERMSSFFAARVNGYDTHMLNNVEGCKEGYWTMASLIPQNAKTLLDLGCGTGLELDAIFARLPDVWVTGIDLTKEMLDVLKHKHPDKNMELICGDYFEVDFGRKRFDCAVSFESLHHFAKEKKAALYQRVFDALVLDGCYVECDYMVETEAEEAYFFSENERLRRVVGAEANTYYHYDTPCTIENQIKLLSDVGFSTVE